MTAPKTDAPADPANKVWVCGNLPSGAAPPRPDAVLPWEKPATGATAGAGAEARPALRVTALPPVAATTNAPAGARQWGANKWPLPQDGSPRKLNVGFIEPRNMSFEIAAHQDRVRRIAPEWCQYANIDFEFFDFTIGDITISFTQRGLSSELGANSHEVSRQGRASMILGFNRGESNEAYMRYIILHEFGHALGLAHEVQIPDRPLIPTRDIVRNYTNVYGNDATFVWEQIQGTIDQLSHLRHENWTDKAAFDRDSIMMYPIPWGCFTYPDGSDFIVEQASGLSAGDIAFIQRMYPGRGTPPPISPPGGQTQTPPPPPFDHPDSALVFGKEITDRLDRAGEVRKYTFKLGSKQTVAITSGGTTGNKTVNLVGPDDPTAVDPLVAGGDGNVSAERRLAAGGYDVTVSLNSGIGPYQLKVSLPDGGDGGSDDGGTTSDSALTLGTEITGRLDAEGRAKKYTFKLDAKKTVRITTGGSGANKTVTVAGPDDPAAVDPLVTGGDGNVDAERRLPAGGYVLTVALNAGVGPYQLKVAVID